MRLQYFDHYCLLGVPQDAPNAAIEAAFRSAMARVPRKGIHRLIACVRGRTESQFIQAFQELSDPVKRKEYDKFLSELSNIPVAPMC